MFQNIINWLAHKYVLYSLRRKYLVDAERDEVLKDWVTDCIVERKQEGRRKEFVEIQNKLREERLFYKWLKAKK